MGELLVEQRGISLDTGGTIDILGGKLLVYDHDSELLVDEESITSTTPS
nr:hypothetical protein [Halorhabdus salina]